MFRLAEPSFWMEALRIPSQVAGEEPGRADWVPTGRRLAWKPARAGRSLSRYSLASVPIYSSDLQTSPPGGNWEPTDALTDDDGNVRTHVWRSEDGIFLPFDPDEAVLALLSERYRTVETGAASSSAKVLLRRGYYRLRPLLPRRAQLTARRLYSNVQRRQRFPAWPVETALDDLYRLLLGYAADAAGDRVPWLAAWPRPYSWALVISHDVETAKGYADIEDICELEETHGYRSAWNLVPRRDYTVEDERVAELQRRGWEVGVHGLRHDGRDLESENLAMERLPEMRSWAERWRARGFRAPATQRQWDLMPRLGFEYDSSYPDTDPFEPQGGGCCSWLPFWNRGLLELPITLPQDHTLFVILQEPDGRIWLEKARVLRERGGMALLDTHPDYLDEDPALAAYRNFLSTFANDETAWRALPSEVAEWWRRRAETTLERRGADWTPTGPAAEDVVVETARPRQPA